MNQGKEPYRRLARHYDITGQAHYLTFSCWRRRPFLSRDRSRVWFLDNLQTARRHFDLWAFVIMPEHVHLLILPHEDATMRQILLALKQPVAQRASWWVRRHAPEFLSSMEDRQPSGRVSHRFWQPGPGYDRNTWSPGELREKVKYIHANPIRRGLVDRPEDWPWSSVRDYTGSLHDAPMTPRGLAVDRVLLPADPRTRI